MIRQPPTFRLDSPHGWVSLLGFLPASAFLMKECYTQLEWLACRVVNNKSWRSSGLENRPVIMRTWEDRTRADKNIAITVPISAGSCSFRKIMVKNTKMPAKYKEDAKRLKWWRTLGYIERRQTNGHEPCAEIFQPGKRYFLTIGLSKPKEYWERSSGGYLLLKGKASP